MKVFIHCGPPRTGTTSFQNLLQDIEGKFIEVLIPRVGWDPNSFGIAHHALLKYDNDFRSISLGEFKISPEPFAEFVSLLHANKNWPGSVVVSTERFASFIWHQIAQLHEQLSSFDCCFVFGARDLLDLHMSIWRKRVELGWRIALDHSIKTIFSELMYMYVFFPKLIASKFGEKAIRMVPYTSNPKENLLRLASACGMEGITTDSAFIAIADAQPVLSESLPYTEVELIRLANEEVCKEMGIFDEWIPASATTRRDEVMENLRGRSLERLGSTFEEQKRRLGELYRTCRSAYSPDGT